LGYEITIDLISNQEEDGRVIDTVTRPLREIPGGSFGINYRREIYPLHEFNGVSGHVHLGGKTYDPDRCPVFEGELRIAQRIVVRGVVDFSGHYHYVLLQCDEPTLLAIINFIEEHQIDITKFGEAVRPAMNGKIYDYFVRLQGWSPSASELAALIADVDESESGYSVIFDAVFERTAEEVEAPHKTATTESESSVAADSVPETANDLLALSRNTDRLIHGLRSAGWSDYELNELSERLADHGVNAVERKSGIPDDDWLEIVSIERAVIIGEWSKHRLEILSDELVPALDQARDELTALEKSHSELQTRNEQLSERSSVTPPGNNSELVAKIEMLESELNAARSDQETWFKELERVSDELDDTKELLASAMSQVDRWKALSSKANAGSETVGDFLGSLLPNIELLRDSESFLSFQLSDRTHVLKDLAMLNDSGRHHRAKALSGIRGWFEIHFSTGDADDGRLYFRKVDNKVRAMLSWKRDQDRVIQLIRRL